MPGARTRLLASFAAIALPTVLACDLGQSATPVDPDAPPPEPMTITLEDLEPISAGTYPVEDGGTLRVTVTNFCDDQTDIGFSPDAGKPPIVWQLQPMQRQEITIPRGYEFRARLSYEDEWTASCATGRNAHLTFNSDCRSCTSGGDDPLEREGCVAAGACSPADPAVPEPASPPAANEAVPSESEDEAEASS